MDQQLEQTFSSILSQSGVVGAVCADKNGLCLCARGTLSPSVSGFITSIAQHSKILSSEKDEIPSICIETESSNIFIRSQEDITVGISKTL